MDDKMQKFIDDYYQHRIEDAEWKGRVEERLNRAINNKVRTEWFGAAGSIIGGVLAGWFGGKASGG